MNRRRWSDGSLGGARKCRFEIKSFKVFPESCRQHVVRFCSSLLWPKEISGKSRFSRPYCCVACTQYDGLQVLVCVTLCTVAITIHPTAEVSEQVNRKCPPRNTILQLSTPYIDPEPSNSRPSKFPNFFINNGLWAVATPYVVQQRSLNERKVRSAISATAELLVTVCMNVVLIFRYV